MGHLSAVCRYKSGRKNNQSHIAEANCNEEVCNNNEAWIFDSAATSHFCGNRDLFSELKPVQGTKMTMAMNGIECDIEGIGKVKMIFGQGRNAKTLTLNDVLYSPRLRRNLMAGPRIDKEGGRFLGGNGKVELRNKRGQTVCTARIKDGLYTLNPRYPVKAEGNSAVSKNKRNRQFEKSKDEKIANTATFENLKLWHERYAHINSKYVVSTSKNGSIRGMPVLAEKDLKCEPCVLAKTRRISFKPINKIRSVKPLELIHMDVCGPLPTAALEGYLYFLTMTDDYSRKVTVFPMKKKSEVFECFTRYQKRAERFLNSKIINIRTDNGLEFCHDEFCRFLENQGIKAERTNTYTPEQNGASERYNRTAMDGVKSMLESSSLDQKFWSEALLCFTYVWNRVCHDDRNKTPFELFGGRKPSVNHLRIFGSTAYMGIPRQKRNKLEMRAQKGILMGYAMKTRGYRIYLPNERKIVETLNVKIVEGEKRSGAVPGPSGEDSNIYRYRRESDSDASSDGNPEQVEIPEEEIEEPEPPPPEDDNVWMRKAVLRKDKSRTDVYYRKVGSKNWFNTIKGVEKYCRDENVVFNPDLFNFSGKDSYSGMVCDPGGSANCTEA